MTESQAEEIIEILSDQRQLLEDIVSILDNNIDSIVGINKKKSLCIPGYMTIEESIKMLNTNRTQLLRYRNKGHLKTYTFGKKKMFKEKDIIKFKKYLGTL